MTDEQDALDEVTRILKESRFKGQPLPPPKPQSSSDPWADYGQTLTNHKDRFAKPGSDLPYCTRTGNKRERCNDCLFGRNHGIPTDDGNRFFCPFCGACIIGMEAVDDRAGLPTFTCSTCGMTA